MDANDTRKSLDLPVLLSNEELTTKIAEMGRRITEDYKYEKSITVIGALKGCFVFMADLVRHIKMPLHIDFIEVSSYGDAMESSGVVKITKDFKHSIEGENILIVEDIIDTGITLNFLVENFYLRKPKSIRIAALLVKDEKQELRYPIDYRGFNIDDKFVVGYGLDYKGYSRNLDYIGYIENDSQLELFNF